MFSSCALQTWLVSISSQILVLDSYYWYLTAVANIMVGKVFRNYKQNFLHRTPNTTVNSVSLIDEAQNQ